MISSIISRIFSDSALPYWEAIEVVCALIVCVGVWGEGWAEKRIFSGHVSSIAERRKALERIFWRLLIFGLAVELICLAVCLVLSNREIAVLKLRTEELQQDNLQLYARIQPRRVTPEQKKEIKDRLSSWVSSMSQCTVKIIVEPFDAEARIFAEQIGDALNQSVYFIVDETLVNPPPRGFGTKFTLPYPPPAWTKAVTNALEILPLEPAEIGFNTNAPANVLEIQVFPKSH